jgi:hypothetical protein
MLRFALPVFLLGVAGVTGLQAQSPARLAESVSGPRARETSPSAVSTVRIMTLAWTETTIPSRLLTPSPAQTPVSQRFVLTWQPLAADTSSGHSPSADQCYTMRLVMVPCE